MGLDLINVFLIHGEPDATEALGEYIGEKLGHSTYIPKYGDTATIHYDKWQVKETDIVIEPAVKELEEFLSLAQADYRQIRRKVFTIVSREPNKLREVVVRLEKVLKYLKKVMNDL